MDLQTEVRAREGVMSTEVDSQAVLMHVETGTYYGLNDVGALIWQRMAKPVRVLDLRDAVLGEFDVTPEACACDVLALLKELESAGLVEIIVAGA